MACKENIKVKIDARCNVTYASFYIYGLFEAYGKRNVHFTCKDFHLDYLSLSHDNHRLLCYIIQHHDLSHKVVIDFTDGTYIFPDFYKWSDIYCKVNLSKKDILQYEKKIYSIPPGFGIRVFNFWETIYISFSNLFRIRQTKKSINISAKAYFRDYFFIWYGRLPYKRYTVNNISTGNYVYFVSSLWNHLNCQKTTNPLRASFIRKNKSNRNVQFEGGLRARDYSSKTEIEKYQDVVIYYKTKMREYIRKTSFSIFVFNTPSVWNCHGWKLAEFLALGKAIISTPLSNELPYPLEHLKNIYIVNNDNELNKAIDDLLSNPEKRHLLEKNALEYWQTWGAPKTVIKNIQRVLT